MRGRSKIVAAFVVSACALQGASQAAVLYTSQEDFAGWAGTGNINRAVTATSLDAGTADGAGGGAGTTAGALELTWSQGAFEYFGGPGEAGNPAFLAALGTTNTGSGYTAASGTLSFDYTTPPPGTGNYFQLAVFFNYNDNFGQFFGVTVVNNGNGTSTGSVNYTINATTSSNYFQIGLIYNSNFNTNTPFTVDNIRTQPVPEPAVLTAALGLFGCALARRRRL